MGEPSSRRCESRSSRAWFVPSPAPRGRDKSAQRAQWEGGGCRERVQQRRAACGGCERGDNERCWLSEDAPP